MVKTFDLSDALNEVNDWLEKSVEDAERALLIMSVVSEDDDKEFILEQVNKAKESVQSILYNLK